MLSRLTNVSSERPDTNKSNAPEGAIDGDSLGAGDGALVGTSSRLVVVSVEERPNMAAKRTESAATLMRAPITRHCLFFFFTGNKSNIVDMQTVLPATIVW